MASKNPSDAITILNFGAGVNSTALAIELEKRGMRPDYAIFADTGSEQPETYVHVKIMAEWFKEHGWNFQIVRSKYGNLYDYYFKKNITPSRIFRDCTGKFKKMPINAFLKTLNSKEIVQYIGIDAGEKQRAVFKGRKCDKFVYPLINWNINREGCLKIIRDAKVHEPIKSGCYCCPFQNNASWLKLLEQHPDLYAASEWLEKNGKRYPLISLPWDTTLEKLRIAKKEQTTLFKKDGLCGLPKCDGWCMV